MDYLEQAKANLNRREKAWNEQTEAYRKIEPWLVSGYEGFSHSGLYAAVKDGRVLAVDEEEKIATAQALKQTVNFIVVRLGAPYNDGVFVGDGRENRPPE